MPYPHRIRLRGPWEFETANATGRIRLPATAEQLPSSGSGAVAAVTLRRRFGKPTNLQPEDEVMLVIEQIPSTATASLNGRRLRPETDEPTAPWHTEITAHLADRNELTLHFPTLAADVALPEARLEIY